MSIKSLIQSVKDGMQALRAERDRLALEINAIDDEIAKLIGMHMDNANRHRGVKRFKNERTLLGTIRHVMGNRCLTLDEVTDLVLKSGYKSHGDVRNMVYQRLIVIADRRPDRTFKLKSEKNTLASNGK